MTHRKMPSRGCSLMMSAVVLAALSSASVPVAAQRTRAAVPTAAARQEFELGVAAMREERYDEALARFEHSYALAPRAATLMNLGSAQLRAGHFVAAIESYRRFLVDASPTDRTRYEADVSRELTAATAAVGHVALRIDGLRAEDQLILDGTSLPSIALEVTLPLDPGGHELVVERAGQRVGQTTFTVRSAETTTAALSLAVADTRARESTTPTAAQTAAAARQDGVPARASGVDDGHKASASSGGLLTSPWFWTVAGVLIAGAAVAVVLVLTSSGDPTATNVGSPMLVF